MNGQEQTCDQSDKKRPKQILVNEWLRNQWFPNFDKKYLSQSVLKRVLYSEITLGGDAHHEKGLEGHEDVLEGVPEVGEEHDEQLVVQVQVKPLQDLKRLLSDQDQDCR